MNNAGFGLAGEFEELPAEQQVGMIDLNVRALTALTRELVPGDGGAAARVRAECGLDGGLPPRPVHVRVLREQGVRAVLLHRAPRRSCGARA